MIQQILEDEYWWYGVVNEGGRMPVGRGDNCIIQIGKTDSVDQEIPLMLSNKGRFIWSEDAYQVEIKNDVMVLDGEVVLEQGYENLRNAYQAAMRKHFPFSGTMPEEHFFKYPQYNTWIELGYDQDEDSILEYASNIISHGYPSGILMIDEGWAEDYGQYDFKKGAFQNPAAMINKLHKMGFLVMLWMTPYISPDSSCFREVEPLGYLIKNHTGETAVRRWWNGLSAVLDLSNEDAVEWFQNKLNILKEKYGVDGFKFDGGDTYMFHDNDENKYHISALKQVEQYNKLADQYKYHEFRAGWKCGGKSIVLRLSDKQHSWKKNGLNTLLPNSIVQGLMGCAYHCPDMIGGGEIKDQNKMKQQVDEELFVRYAQAASLCPMMQFSAAPWKVLNDKNQKIVRKAALLHEKMSGYIVECARSAAKTGEPIMRHMEYQYPEHGYELINDQFMLGDKILVAPILNKDQKSRIVTLPEGTWLDDMGNLWNGGGRIEVEVSLERLPYFRKYSEVER